MQSERGVLAVAGVVWKRLLSERDAIARACLPAIAVSVLAGAFFAGLAQLFVSADQAVTEGGRGVPHVEGWLLVGVLAMLALFEGTHHSAEIYLSGKIGEVGNRDRRLDSVLTAVIAGTAVGAAYRFGLVGLLVSLGLSWVSWVSAAAGSREGLSWFRSLSRSWQLVRLRAWFVLGMVLLSLLVRNVVEMLASLLAVGFSRDVRTTAWSELALFVALTALVRSLAIPFGSLLRAESYTELVRLDNSRTGSEPIVQGSATREQSV